MDIQQVHALIDKRSLPGSCNNMQLKETHISWIILSDDYAFKIKRPVRFSFVDFSTLASRKHFCQEELRLNKRLAPDMYLGVLPLTGKMIDEGTGPDENIIDYAVQMKRMDDQKAMDKLLISGNVTDSQITNLAVKIADFHRKAETVRKEPETDNLFRLFADIGSEISFLNEHLSGARVKTISDCIDGAGKYLRENENLISDRINSGLYRDGHGDLNSSNIFLYDDPVIFDCIEFNPEFRRIDIFNEIAFQLTDLDFFGREDLSELLLQKYCKSFNTIINREEIRLLNFYKSYRANVRAKVTLLKVRDEDSGTNSDDIRDALKYLDLMEKYSRKTH
jgi:uncharacterized protein